MSDARRRAEEADPIRRMLRHLCNVYGCTSYGRTADHGPEDCAWCEAEALLAEEDERGAVAAEIAGLPVHFVAHLPRGRVFMHPDTPKSGARDAWPPPMPSMIPVPIAPAPPDADEPAKMAVDPEDSTTWRSADGSMLVSDLVSQVMDLHPGADRLAVELAAYCAAKPPKRPKSAPPAADEVREAAEAWREATQLVVFVPARLSRALHALSALAARGGA